MGWQAVVILIIEIVICWKITAFGFKTINHSVIAGVLLMLMGFVGLIYLLCIHVFHHTPWALIAMFQECLRLDNCY